MRVSGLRTILPWAILLAAIVVAGPMLLGGGREESGEDLADLASRPAPEPAPAPAPDPVEPLDPPPPKELVPAELFGRIRGDPLPVGAGAWIQVTGAREPYRAVLGEDASYRFRQLPSGVSLDLWLGPDPGGSEVCRLASGIRLSPHERRQLDLTAKTGATLRGVVRDPAGRPLPGVRVAVLPPGADWRYRVPIAARTDLDGRFFVGLAEGQEPEPLRLVVDAVDRGFILDEILVGPADLRSGVDRVIELTPGLTIAGLAVGPEGQPLAGAEVHLLERSAEDLEDRRPVEGRVFTDEEGRFTDGAYRPGVYFLHLCGELDGREYAVARSDVVAGDEEVVVRFEGFGSLEARFENEETRRPVEASEVSAVFVWGIGETTEYRTPWENAPGGESVEFDDLPTGHYRLRIAAPGYQARLTELFFVEPGRHVGPVVWRLSPR